MGKIISDGCNCCNPPSSSSNSESQGSGSSGSDNQTVLINCCSTELPTTLTATFINATDCPELHMQEIQLRYDFDDGKWTGSKTFCDPDVLWTIDLFCSGSSCSSIYIKLNASDTICLVGSVPKTIFTVACQCEPLSLEFVNSGVGLGSCDCCLNGTVEGRYRIFITE